MIDYVIVNETCDEFVIEFKVVERVDSDHLPLVLKIDLDKKDKEEDYEEEERDKVKEDERKTIICWDKEAVRYKGKTEKTKWTEGPTIRKTEEKWEKLKGIIDKALIRKKKVELGERSWWDRSCTKGKRKVKRVRRKWRKGKKDRETYLEEGKK